jgi:hypothetical protein
MNSSVKLLLVPVFAGILMVTGITAALAQSQVGGNLSSNGSSTPSYADGGLVASVADPSATTVSQGNSSAAESGDRVSRSGSRRSAPYGGAQPSSDPVIFIDTVSASGEFSGTGGGFDPEAEQAIAAASSGDSDDNSLSPSDAVAFNNSQNPLLANTDLVAATGDSGLGSARVWTAVVLGLALLGLAGYAVNALISYRRENDL